MQYKKNIYIIFYFIMIIFIVIFIYFFINFFQIKQIDISGIDISEKNHIINSININNKNLVILNKFYLTKKIKKKFSHIKEVKVNKIYPKKIQLIITPTKPIARILDIKRKNLLIIDIDGKVMTNSIKISKKKLISIYTLNSNNLYIIKIVVQILNFLHSIEFLHDIEYIDIVNLNDIKIGYQNRLEIKIGDLNKLNRKFALLKNIIIRLSPSDNGTLDINNEKKIYFIPKQ